MTKAEIITKFHLYMDDTSELSSAEEEALFDKIYSKVMTDRPWEISKREATGTLSITVPYVSLPTRFAYLTANANYTEDNAYAAAGPVVFVGTGRTPYKIVSWSDRGQYVNLTGYAYIDIVNSRLVFCKQPAAADTYSFDYVAFPTALTTAESPVFPSDYHHIIFHGMCVDDFIIQQSDKAKSYAAENNAMYKSYLEDLAMWNSRLVQI
ncbi:MAG: hypothetical protein WC767_02260 [Candidatus Paceibacterota bacterium]|jgi:hypothetical protein